MSFYLSNGDAECSDVRQVYRNNRVGFGAKRIPRKAKKQLRRDWLAARKRA